MSYLNLNLGVNILSNAKLTKSDVSVKYGANKKNLDKTINFSSVVKHQLAWRASDVSLNAQLQHPETVSVFLYINNHLCVASIFFEICF